MIDLTTWNLTIPVGSPAIVIDTPSLSAGYQDQYFNSKDGTLYFWAPVSGSTTINSEYPRSELRETFANGKLHNWSYKTTNSLLNARVKITQVPSNGLLAFSQIHSKQSQSPLLMLVYQYVAQNGYGNVVISFRGNPADNNSTKILLFPQVKLNEEFSYQIYLGKSGNISITLTQQSGAMRRWSNTVNEAWAGHGLYFKAGVYTLDNTGYRSEAGATVFNQLEVEHH